MRRFIALTGSALALLVSLACARAAATTAPPLQIVNAAFVGAGDPSLHALLTRIGATIAWRRGSGDVLVTTAEHAVIAFTAGDRRYHEGDVTAQARYAPYIRNGVPFLPEPELLSALSLEGFPRGQSLVLEPLISSLDVRAARGGATIVARAATPLRPRIISAAGPDVRYEFDGVGTTVAGTRTVDEGGIASVTVRTYGQLASARTFLTVTLVQNARVQPARSDDGRDFVLTVASHVAAANSQTTVTAVSVLPALDAFTIAIAVSGDAQYSWHRLLAPDNRFWLDISGARSTTIARDDRWLGRVTGVRVSQLAPSVVRIALSLADEQAIDVVPSSRGVRIVVRDDLAADAPRNGSGSIGSLVAASVATPLPPAEPQTTALLTPAPYRPSYVPANPRLIVIDPGHGGNDPGTIFDGREEKTFTLDIALRLRDILIARGWQVRMTRASDTEVDPSAQTDHDELQARDDVANDNGARIFISIHVNAYSEPGPHGTTSFYSKPEDVPLARDVEDAIARGAGMQNDGIVKSKLYVTYHARMPAVLVETAFITNPGDLRRLESPSWRQRVAQAMADGIAAYARENPIPTSYQQ